jgi:hypothetical protein
MRYRVYRVLRSRRAVKASALFAGIIAALSLEAIGSARATTIEIDLGPPGKLPTSLAVPFTDLNGTSLSHQLLSLNFVFSGNQFVRLFSVTTDFEVAVKLQTNSPGSPGFIMNGIGFLRDQLGNPIQPPQDLGAADSSDGWTSAGLLPLLPGSGAPNRPFDFFEVHFDLTLPNNSSFQVTGSEFELLAFGLGGPFGVGPHVPTDIVPDQGSTLLLLSLASLGLIPARRRLTRIG